MRLLSVLLLTVSLAACASPRPIQFGPLSGWGAKTVDAKEAPATLYAVDSSVCVVTPRKFDRVKIGDRVTCRWAPRGTDSPFPRT
jgi:hypothetical protein